MIKNLYLHEYGVLWLILISPLVYAEQTHTDTTKLIEQLQQGGYVIFLRHATTNTQEHDQSTINMDDCTTQRNLSPRGKNLARKIGLHFLRLKIPVGEVYTSTFCRCVDTAELAFGQGEKVTWLNFSIGIKKTERQWMSEKLRSKLATPLEGRYNLVIVAHTANLKEAVNIWPKQEGEMHIFRYNAKAPDNPIHLGVILPDFWY